MRGRRHLDDTPSGDGHVHRTDEQRMLPKMPLFSILNAQRRSGKPPTIEKQRWTEIQTRLAEEGLCVSCGNHRSQPTSYLCESCEGEGSMEDIRSELQRVRNRILKR
jgi:hypothetical protein